MIYSIRNTYYTNENGEAREIQHKINEEEEFEISTITTGTELRYIAESGAIETKEIARHCIGLMHELYKLEHFFNDSRKLRFDTTDLLAEIDALRYALGKYKELL